jgi:putative PIN family toxin of toxin-antitoxin system
MRVLLDTNVLARAAGGPPSPAHEVFLRLTHYQHSLIWSNRLSNELLRILRYERVRPIHKLSDAEIDEFVAGIGFVAEMVDSSDEAPAVVPADPDDDYVVQTAVAGIADIICTRDRDLLHPSVIAYCGERGIRMMNDVELLTMLRGMEHRS